MTHRLFYFGLLAIASAVGCNNGGSSAQTSSEPEATISMNMPPPATVEIHEHPMEGPHQGSLIELGKDEFHAELVHDEKMVMIYVLDSAAKNSVPVDASEMVINLIHDGKPKQFTLAATPEASDPAGKSSRFVANDPELAHHMDDATTAPKLSITINRKSYRGVITHEHAHE